MSVLFTPTRRDAVHVPDFCDGRKGEDLSLYGRLAVWAKKSLGSKGGGRLLVSYAG